MKNTVTSVLRKTISKITPSYPVRWVFSDSRKNKTAVGVKICGKPFSEEELNKISSKMKNEGFTEIKITYNNSNRSNFNGTRFTYFKN